MYQTLFPVSLYNDVFSFVKMSKSNAEQVVLKKVQINSSGYYKCEVSPGTCLRYMLICKNKIDKVVEAKAQLHIIYNL